jgi:hypothetical protein
MAVIGAIVLIPIVLLIVVLFLQINADATFYGSERVGVAYTKAVRPLFVDLEVYRAVGATAGSGVRQHCESSLNVPSLARAIRGPRSAG